MKGKYSFRQTGIIHVCRHEDHFLFALFQEDNESFAVGEFDLLNRMDAPAIGEISKHNFRL